MNRVFLNLVKMVEMKFCLIEDDFVIVLDKVIKGMLIVVIMLVKGL